MIFRVEFQDPAPWAVMHLLWHRALYGPRVLWAHVN